MSKRIAVVGLGAIGAQALWNLSRTPGVEVHGYEQHTVGHGFGASGGDGRVFRTIQYEDPNYVPLIQRAELLWQELEEESQQQLRVRTGFLFSGSEGCPQAVKSIEGIDRYNLNVDQLTVSELRERFPFQSYRDDDIGLYDHDGGIIRPELTIISAVAVAVSRGATVHEGSRVAAITENSSTVTIRVSGGEQSYDQVIVATGAWAPQLAPSVSEGVIQPRKVVSAWYFPRRSGSLAGIPPFLRPAPVQFYGVPSQDGLSVKLGLSGIHHEDVEHPDDADYVVREQNLEGFVPRVADYFPGLHPQPFRVETYFEGYTADSRPILQRVADESRITYAVGFSGHGFKLSPLYGAVAANLALGAAIDPHTVFLQRAFAA
jgi:sarcosine oxidase